MIYFVGSICALGGFGVFGLIAVKAFDAVTRGLIAASALIADHQVLAQPLALCVSRYAPLAHRLVQQPLVCPLKLCCCVLADQPAVSSHVLPRLWVTLWVQPAKRQIA